MSVVSGRIVVTPDGKYPYKLVLEHEDGESEYPVATVHEGEALLRARLPANPAPSRREGGLLFPGSATGTRA
jgi:hypothetical protein